MPRQPSYLIQLTAEELDLLRTHGEPEGAIDRFIGPQSPRSPLISLDLNARELLEFMTLLDQTASHAQNVIAMDRLGHALARIESGLEGTADPGAHLLRPAAARTGYSVKQGRYLAFIFNYLRLNRRAPAEADFQAYFGSTPPTVHEMLKMLTRRGFIARTPGAARSIKLLLRAHEIPELD